MTEWLPGVSELTVSDADPPLRVTVPITVDPSLNVTEPVELDGATVAMNVTEEGSLIVVADADKVVVVAITFTVTVVGLLVPGSCVVSP